MPLGTYNGVPFTLPLAYRLAKAASSLIDITFRFREIPGKHAGYLVSNKLPRFVTMNLHRGACFTRYCVSSRFPMGTRLADCSLFFFTRDDCKLTVESRRRDFHTSGKLERFQISRVFRSCSIHFKKVVLKIFSNFELQKFLFVAIKMEGKNLERKRTKLNTPAHESSFISSAKGSESESQ